MNDNNYKLLCIKLIKKLQDIIIGLVHHTENPTEDSKNKLFKLKEMADSLMVGLEKNSIFSGVSIINKSETEILEMLLDKLNKTL